MKNHLSANDYYSESERIIGQWHGKTAHSLGLHGKEVTAEDFESLRSNRHPETGKKLTPRRPKVAFHDFVISAPKSASIVAMVGGDQRVIDAYDQCVLRAFERLESFAAVRVRTGEAYHTESLRRTGNAIAAVFRHDTSRLLDPQLHTHLVFANLTWDQTSGRWLALQPKEMAEQSKEWIRKEFYRELANECRRLGYSVEKDGEAFRLTDIDKSIEHSFRQRTLQRERFETRYKDLFGQAPDKKRIEQFIKDHKATATRRFKEEYHAQFGTAPTSKEITEFVQDWRSSKMAHSTREKVQELQRDRISADQAKVLHKAVHAAQRVGQEEIPKLPSSEPSTNSAKHHHTSDQENLKSNEMPRDMWEEWQQSLRYRYEEKKKQNERRKQRQQKRRAMQRLRKAKLVTMALNGHPVKLMARHVQQLARKKHHGTQRRTY